MKSQRKSYAKQKEVLQKIDKETKEKKETVQEKAEKQKEEIKEEIKKKRRDIAKEKQKKIKDMIASSHEDRSSLSKRIEKEFDIKVLPRKDKKK